MERELFDWSSWDGDVDCMVFYDPVLKVQIGKFPVGTKFDFANLSFEKGELEFFCDEELIASFKLHFQITEK